MCKQALLRHGVTVWLSIVLATTCDGAVAAASLETTTPTTPEYTSAFEATFIAITTAALITLAIITIYPPSGAAPSIQSSLEWTTDEGKTFADFDSWERDLMVHLTSVSRTQIMDTRALTVAGYKHVGDNMALPTRLYDMLSVICTGGAMGYLTIEHEVDKRGDILWSDIKTYYTQYYLEARVTSAQTFYNNPDGSNMNWETWTIKLAKTLSVCESINPEAFTALQLLVNAMSVNEANKPRTPPEISEVLRQQLRTTIDTARTKIAKYSKPKELEGEESSHAKAERLKQLAKAEASITLFAFRTQINKYFEINPPMITGNTHSADGKRPQKKTCRYFKRHGNCRFEDKCHFEHVTTTAAPRKQQQSGSAGKKAKAADKKSKLCRNWTKGVCKGKSCKHGYRHFYHAAEQNTVNAALWELSETNGATAGPAISEPGPTTTIHTVAQEASAPTSSTASPKSTRGKKTSAFLAMIQLISFGICVILPPVIQAGPEFSSDVSGDGPRFSRHVQEEDLFQHTTINAIETLNAPLERSIHSYIARGTVMFHQPTNRTAIIAEESSSANTIHAVTTFDNKFEYVTNRDITLDTREETHHGQPVPFTAPTSFHDHAVDNQRFPTGVEVAGCDLDIMCVHLDDNPTPAPTIDDPLFQTTTMSADEIEQFADMVMDDKQESPLLREPQRVEHFYGAWHDHAMSVMEHQLRMANLDVDNECLATSDNYINVTNNDSVQADSGTFFTIVRSPSMLHEAQPVHNWKVRTANAGSSGTACQVTHKGTLKMKLSSNNGMGSFVMQIPAIAVPSIHTTLINTTALWQQLNYSGTITPALGTTWETPQGHQYLCPTRHGQEYFDGTILYPTMAAHGVADNSISEEAKLQGPAKIDRHTVTDRIRKQPLTDTRDSRPPVPQPQPSSAKRKKKQKKKKGQSKSTVDHRMTDPIPGVMPKTWDSPQNLTSSAASTPTAKVPGVAAMPTPAEPTNSMEVDPPTTTPTSTEERTPLIHFTPDDVTPLKVKPEFIKAIRVLSNEELIESLKEEGGALTKNSRDAIRIELAHRRVITTDGNSDLYLALHTRLGHISHADTLAIAAKMGLKIGKYASIVCDECEQYKARRQSIPKTGNNPHKYNPLETWNIDIFGPTATMSTFGKNRYTFGAIDQATRSSIVIPMSSISQGAMTDAIEKFGALARQLLKHAQNKNLTLQIGPRVTTDSAATFKSLASRQAFLKNGFSVLFHSPPYSQALNARIERLWGTIIPSARCMLKAAGLSDGLLPEAIEHASLIYNLTPHSALGGISPDEALTGTPPDLSKIHRFGTPIWCYVHERSKAEPKGRPGHYVGMDRLSQSHLCYTKAPLSGRAVKTASMHIRFNHSIPPPVLQCQVETLPDNLAFSLDHATDIGVNYTEDFLLEPPTCEILDEINGIQPDKVWYSLAAAQRSENGEAFTGTLEEEMSGLRKMRALVPTKTSELTEAEIHNAKNVTTLFYWKKDMHGEWVPKCRTVFAGKGQVKGHDYDLVSSHTPRWTTIRCHLGLQPKTPEEHCLRQYDLKKFFCHAENETVSGHRVVVKIPIHARYTDDSGYQYQYAICETSLYGQRNAGYLAQQMLWKHMKDTGWVQGYDPTSWTRGRSRVVWWTDDALFRGPTDEADLFEAELNKTFPGVKSKDASFYLGHHVQLNRHGTISISAEQTIRDLCTRHDVKYTKETPLPPGCTPSKLEGAHDPAYVKPMQQITGSVSYLATTVRCDIGHAASTLGQVSHNPNDKQLAAAKHTLRYLNGTADLGLQWSIQKESTRNRVECWVDASYADNKGFKSQTGYIFMLNGAPVSWASKTQRFVSTSSTEAEIVAACDAVKECAFIKALLNSWNTEEWPCAVNEPIVCLEDNESCINWFDNGLISSRAKHYGTRMYYIRDQIKKTRLVTFKHVSTKDQRADALTKSLAKAHQRRHTDKIMQQIFKDHINFTMSVCHWTIPG